jgi:hypothetical protein
MMLPSVGGNLRNCHTDQIERIWTVFSVSGRALWCGLWSQLDFQTLAFAAASENCAQPRCGGSEQFRSCVVSWSALSKQHALFTRHLVPGEPVRRGFQARSVVGSAQLAR